MSYASTILAASPTAYWRMDNPSGLVATDISGNGYNATLSSVAAYSQPGAITGDTDTSIQFNAAGGIGFPGALSLIVGSWSAASFMFWINFGSGWHLIVETTTTMGTTYYLDGVITTPGTVGSVLLSTDFTFGGSLATSGYLDEVVLFNYALSSTLIQTIYQLATGSTATGTSTVIGVHLLINDVHFPTIRQETISINRAANDPISTFTVAIQDDPSHIAISELMEVVFIDADQQSYPTHNLIVNPLISPHATNYTTTSATGGTITDLSPGVQFTASNAVGTFSIAQIMQYGLVVAGQQYMLSCAVSTGTMTNCSAFLSMVVLDGTGASIASATTLIGSSTTVQATTQILAPTGAATIQVSLGISQTSGTNSGTAMFASLQLEPMTFLLGNSQQSYPTPFCAVGQANCVVLPDSTTIRQYRLFGGYITKATAGNYIGNNRQWAITVSGYAWLLQKQQLNNTWTSQTDAFIIGQIVATYFPKQFSTAQVIAGATIDTFGYAYNGTARDAFDALATVSTYYYYIDAYRVIWYQAPGFQTLGFALSDQPDNVVTFPYYNYARDIDATQLGNATLVTGATNISAIEYDAQSIAYYNQKTNGLGVFWRTVSDSSITTTTAARQRAIAENANFNYARPIVHLSTNELMIPGYTCLFTSATDGFFEEPFFVQKSTLVILGWQSIGIATYECQCDIGAFNPDGSTIITRILRKQQVSTNSIGTPVVGLMITDSTTFVDTIVPTTNTGTPATYGTGIYNTSVYYFAVPGVPTTKYGTGTYGDMTHGYN